MVDFMAVRARSLSNGRPEREAGKLLTEAEDCELIGKLATDLKKRELFAKLATDLRSMAQDIQAMISTRKQEAVSHEIKARRRVPKAPQ
jgi:hypothetical protein